MTTRPYGLTPKDLEDVPAELVERRLEFVTAHCERRGRDTNPGRLTSAQLFEILNHEEWPK